MNTSRRACAFCGTPLHRSYLRPEPLPGASATTCAHRIRECSTVAALGPPVIANACQCGEHPTSAAALPRKPFSRSHLHCAIPSHRQPPWAAPKIPIPARRSRKARVRPGHDRALIWRSCRSRGTAPSTSPPPQPTCSCGRHSRRSGPCTPCRPGSMSSTRWRRRGPRRRRREASRASR